MNRNIKQLIPLIMLASTGIGCQKSVDSTPSADEVSISISSPAEQQVYSKGDTILINAEINSGKMLHGYIVTITDESGAMFFEAEGHSHSGTIQVKELWVNTLDVASDLTLEVTAVLDHNQLLKNAKTAFRSQP